MVDDPYRQLINYQCGDRFRIHIAWNDNHIQTH